MKGGTNYISDGITYIQNSIKSVTMTEEQIINQKELEAVKLENKTRFIDAAEYKKTILENAYNTAIQNAEKDYEQVRIYIPVLSKNNYDNAKKLANANLTGKLSKMEKIVTEYNTEINKVTNNPDLTELNKESELLKLDPVIDPNPNPLIDMQIRAQQKQKYIEVINKIESEKVKYYYKIKKITSNYVNIINDLKWQS
jgi:hypothetical protein